MLCELVKGKNWTYKEAVGTSTGQTGSDVTAGNVRVVRGKDQD